MPTIVTNARARHEYEILQTYEAGIALQGAEVKSVRNGNIKLTGSYAVFLENGLWLVNAHIALYEKAGIQPSYDPTRKRLLLLTAKEFLSLRGKLAQKGLTLIPLSVYTSKHRIKVELGLARGKKQYEKRAILKKRAVQKEIRESLKRNQRRNGS